MPHDKTPPTVKEPDFVRCLVGQRQLDQIAQNPYKKKMEGIKLNWTGRRMNLVFIEKGKKKSYNKPKGKKKKCAANSGIDVKE